MGHLMFMYTLVVSYKCIQLEVLLMCFNEWSAIIWSKLCQEQTKKMPSVWSTVTGPARLLQVTNSQNFLFFLPQIMLQMVHCFSS